ncbi:hypothetical protein LRS05_12540 [Flavobacterium sp. J372]|uniref:hypothetical protein n=1 Tax=Flavobacterium sp. J372 TaxID=2898436 RepID=UPI00215089E0|nr:hypothetical protein [Flavobacterium sp. J372]MCR5862910.1 hypothetical protein [Flavobacterium sp. J372]
MQDLLNEDDFKLRPQYNPWPRFLLFYAIEVAAIIVNILLMLLADADVGIIAMLTIVLLPLILAPIMILAKNRNKIVTDRQAVRGMLILFLIYLAPVLLAMLGDALTTGIDSGGVIITVVLITLYTICFITIFTILRKRRRRV